MYLLAVRKLLPCLFLCLAAGASAQQSAPLEAGAETWKLRAERARALRRESQTLRDKADAQRQQDDRACRSSFFENACRDDARDTWLGQVNAARAMDMEAVGLERAIRANDLAQRERDRPARVTSLPSLQWVGGVSAPAAASAPVTPVAAPVTQSAPKAAPVKAPREGLRRVSPQARAEQAEDRARKAAAAAERAAQAKDDAARYAERQREQAARKAASSSAGK